MTDMTSEENHRKLVPDYWGVTNAGELSGRQDIPLRAVYITLKNILGVAIDDKRGTWRPRKSSTRYRRLKS